MHAEAFPTMPVEETAMEQSRNVQNGITFQLQSSYGHLIQKRKNETEETDAMRAAANYGFHYYDIASTAAAIVFRFIAIYSSIKLALDFHQNGDVEYFLWTIVCLCVSLVVTSVIHCFMCYEDGKFKKSFSKTVKTCFWIVMASVFMRYYKSLIYAIRCKRAQQNGDKESQIRFYKLAIKEESDVAFMKLFECFLESAPQKILQISIVLAQQNEITVLQIIVICINFISMAWCLTVYHRYVRYSQEDKFNMNLWGHICQLCWHFSTAVSRTLTIAFIATIFPLFTLYGCLIHAKIVGTIIFLADRPCCPKAIFPNYLFCLVFGIIYLFTYISTRDESTFYKYIMYYVTCLIENVACIYLFATYATNDLKSLPFLVYLLCSGALAFYVLGIIIMIIYYSRFHPNITARKSQRLMINNN